MAHTPATLDSTQAPLEPVLLDIVSTIASLVRGHTDLGMALPQAFNLLGTAAHLQGIRLVEQDAAGGHTIVSHYQRLALTADDTSHAPSILSLPVCCGETLWGSIEFERFSAIDEWTSAERAAFQLVADLVGAALERQSLARARDVCEHRFQALFEETNDAIFILGLDGQHVAVNRRAAELLGYERDELLKLTTRQVVAEQEHAHSEQVKEQLLAGQHIPVYERRFVNKSGEEIPVELNVTLVRDVAGKPLYIQSAARDISERKVAEDGLHERRRALHLVISSMPNLLLLLDTQNCISAFYAPPHFRTLLDAYGIEPGRPLAALMPPAMTGHVTDILQHVRTTGEIREIDHRVTLPNRTIYLRIKVSPVTESQDILVVIDDVTDRRLAEEALTRRDAILETLAYASDKLLLNQPEVVIPDLLRRLGQTVAASHVYILENVTLPDSSIRPRLCYEWVSPDIPRPPHGAASSSQIDLEISFARWAMSMAEGDPIWGMAQDFPEPERSLLDQQGIKSIALAPIFSEGVWWGVVGFGERTRDRTWLHAEIEAFKSIAAALGAAFARERSHTAEQEQRALAQALGDIGSTLNRTLDLDQVLEHILVSLDRVAPHDSANIMLIDEGVARLARARGYAERGADDTLGAVYFPANSLFDLRQFIEEGQPVAIPDTQAYPDWAALPETQFIRSYAGAPIRLDGEIIGFLNVDSAEPHLLSQAQAERLQAFADQTAIAIRNARLYREIQSMATFQERQRLARELHDGVSQSLSSANLIADVLPRVWEQSPERGQKALAQLHQLTRSALAEMRMLLMELRPEAIFDTRIQDLLLRLVQVASSRGGLNVMLEADEVETEPPPKVKFTLYRITQEGLNNLVKHARATEARVVLRVDARGAALLIEDNGAGFDPRSVAADHFGLGIMRERASEIGATLEINSTPGQGATIVVQWSAPEDTTPS